MIKREDVEKLSKLSAIGLSEEETDYFFGDMKAIIEFAKQIESDYEENEYVNEENQDSMRDDIEIPSYKREQILKNAKTSQKGFFKIPQRSI